MTKLASIISFCTHDLRFLDRCIKSISLFSDQILIPVCDHFYNGKAEDLDLLQRIYAKYPEVDFIEFAYSETEVYGTPSRLVPYTPGWAQHWHSTARLIGTYFLKPEIDAVLFLDVDEIFEREPTLGNYDAIRFATYWYHKTADHVATTRPDGPLLVKREKLTHELLLNEDERCGMFEEIRGKKIRSFSEKNPLVHHYSFVRTPSEMLAKVRSWGHHWERDWEKLIDEEGDFVRGYTYEKREPYWDPLQEKIVLPEQKALPKHRVSPKDIFRMELAQYLSKDQFPVF